MSNASPWIACSSISAAPNALYSGSRRVPSGYPAHKAYAGLLGVGRASRCTDVEIAWFAAAAINLGSSSKTSSVTDDHSLQVLQLLPEPRLPFWRKLVQAIAIHCGPFRAFSDSSFGRIPICPECFAGPGEFSRCLLLAVCSIIVCCSCSVCHYAALWRERNDIFFHNRSAAANFITQRKHEMELSKFSNPLLTRTAAELRNDEPSRSSDIRRWNLCATIVRRHRGRELNANLLYLATGTRGTNCAKRSFNAKTVPDIPYLNPLSPFSLFKRHIRSFTYGEFLRIHGIFAYYFSFKSTLIFTLQHTRSSNPIYF